MGDSHPLPFEPECSSGDSVPGRSNGKKSPGLFQTLFGKGGMQTAAAFSQLWQAYMIAEASWRQASRRLMDKI
jgi:hypothetical protein